jgi:hypothetical protein
MPAIGVRGEQALLCQTFPYCTFARSPLNGPSEGRYWMQKSSSRRVRDPEGGERVDRFPALRPDCAGSRPPQECGVQ